MPEPTDATPLTPPATSELDGPPPEPRQRWRLVVAREADAPPLAQRELADAWIDGIEQAGLPLAWTAGARPRPRVTFGAPLPIAMAAEGELIDLVLTERWPVWRLREALAGRSPPGWSLIDLYDEWLTGPPLAGRVGAADYRITLEGDVDAASFTVVAAVLLRAESLTRERARGSGTVAYDLRPLLVDVRVVDEGPPVVVVARTRFHPELGTGRPEEVVAALGEAAGTSLGIASIVRERLILADDLG